MTLQQIFIGNLKKFRKERNVSQMTLAELCDTSGNYIGEIEMGRRIPSFEKIEKIASALRINAHELFIQERINTGKETDAEKERDTKDYLKRIPLHIKKEIVSRLLISVQKGIADSLDANNY
jgi:transcriptional regulator with XRE-family HTH domain